MKRGVFLVLISLLLILSTNNNILLAQESVQITDIELINLGDGQLFGQSRGLEKTPINGKIRIISGYSSEYIDAEFLDGYAIGKWEYYRNSKLSEVATYKNGYEDGEKLSYHNDGTTLRAKTPLAKGKVNGTIIRYNSDGEKEYEKTMKDGVDNGPERTYGKGGEITSEIIFKNGKAEGRSFAFYNKDYNDCYKRTEFYKNGKLEGEYKEEYCDGSPKVTGKYIAGNKDGLWEYYKKDGKRNKPTEGYNNGDLIKKITYYADGSIDTERGYKNGKEHGTTKQYTQDGTLKLEKNYIEGKPVGKQMQFYSSSNHDYIETCNYSADGRKNGEFSQIYAETNSLKVKGKYVNDQKEGIWTTSDIKGRSVKEEEYKNGKLLGSKKIEQHTQSERYPAYTSTTLFDENGYKTGEYTEIYDTTKKIKKKGQYVKSRQDGEWLFYDENGKLEKEEVYENGTQKSSQKF